MHPCIAWRRRPPESAGNGCEGVAARHRACLDSPFRMTSTFTAARAVARRFSSPITAWRTPCTPR